jgi:hypothetical protein
MKRSTATPHPWQGGRAADPGLVRVRVEHRLARSLPAHSRAEKPPPMAQPALHGAAQQGSRARTTPAEPVRRARRGTSCRARADGRSDEGTSVATLGRRQSVVGVDLVDHLPPVPLNRALDSTKSPPWSRSDRSAIRWLVPRAAAGCRGLNFPTPCTAMHRCRQKPLACSALGRTRHAVRLVRHDRACVSGFGTR